MKITLVRDDGKVKYLTDVENRAPSGADENGSQGATCLQNEGSFEI